LVGAEPAEFHRAAQATGARSLWRFAYATGEPEVARRARVEALARSALPLWGVMVAPVGEPEGLDTLRLVASLRLGLPEVPHLVLDVGALGPRLAQMALAFGGDELWAPIVSERALRLGDNARNPAMTRKEAAVLIRGAGLDPRERLGPDRFEDANPPGQAA
jgi:2-iminoacetate synthase ThiH